jgi:hypothetical protein
MTKVIFHSHKPYNIINDSYHPRPVKDVVPEWFKSADKYELNKETGKYWENDLGGFVMSFKACPGLLDIFISGYTLVTPCDITFYKNENGVTCVKTESGYDDFVGSRAPMLGFPVPHGHLDYHFHWYPNWAPEVPDGYSILYTNPINRYDLPFITTSGIIDNDKMNTPGFVPFFIQDNFIGTIRKGTPYLQLFPYKREDWEMEIKHHNLEEIHSRHMKSANMFRVKDGGAYKKLLRVLKRYS